MRYENIKAAVAENLSLPKEVLLDLPIVTVTCGEITIENFKSLRGFSSECVVINANKAKITVFGSELYISYLSRETIVIRGNIGGINFEKGLSK